MQSRVLWSFALAVAATGAIGCACSTTTRARDAGVGRVETSCTDGVDNDGDGLPDCADPDCSTQPVCDGVDAGGFDAPRIDVGLMECAATHNDGINGTAPVDIVWVVDNSGSMTQEAELIGMNFPLFVDRIVGSGITDYHVIVISDAGFVPVPDDPEHFLALPVNVQSHDAFERAVQWIMPGTPTGYAGFLRRESALHFVFVTDDESNTSWESFRSNVRAMLGRDFFGHAIVSPPGSCMGVCNAACMCAHGCVGPFCIDVTCRGPYGDGAGNGDEYWELAMNTGGVAQNICSPDWTAVFNALLERIAIAVPLPCNFRIPDPPAGETFDRNLVNVTLTPTGATAGTLLPRSDDCSNPAGWFYDDPTAPTQIVLCDGSCGSVMADPSASIDIALGCETVVF